MDMTTRRHYSHDKNATFRAIPANSYHLTKELFVTCVQNSKGTQRHIPREAQIATMENDQTKVI